MSKVQDGPQEVVDLEVLPLLKVDRKRKVVKRDAQVGVQVVIRRIYDVDNIHQTFTCALTIFNYWFVGDGDHESYLKETEEEGDEWKPNKFPRLHISNNTDCNWSDAQFAYNQNEQKCTRVIDCTTTIRDEMEFQNFPFDYQLLPIKISLKHDKDDWEFVPFGYTEASGVPAIIDHKSAKQISVLNKLKISLPDFNFLPMPISKETGKGPEQWEQQILGEFGCLRTIKFDDTNGLRSSMSQICIHVPIERRSLFYVTNNFGVMFLITSTTFLVWVVEVSEAGDRLALDMTVLLTIVAFKLVQAGLIPAVSYLTILDVYTFLNFVVVLGASVCHFVAFYKEGIDNTLWYCCISIWMIINVLFVLQCHRLSAVNYEHWKRERERYHTSGNVWYLEQTAQCTNHKKDDNLSLKKKQ